MPQSTRKFLGRVVCVFAVLGLVAATQATVRAQGIIMPGAGPINRSMAGASTAAPVDFGGSYWNPAGIGMLPRSEFLIGSELILPSMHLQTFLPQGSIGNFPPANRTGTVRSNSGVASNLATGTAFRLSPDSPWTYGLGVWGMVGGSVNFPGDNSVPLVAGRVPPNSYGFGPIYSNLSLLSITPMASLRLSDALVIGGGPVITTGTGSFSPAFFAPGPKDENRLPTFPAATNARPFWGAGFQLGLIYEVNENWNVGFSYKSPVWQERWSYNSSFPNGSPRYIGLQAGVPAIYSWGIAYKGIENLLIDIDLRYMDYANTPLFGQSVPDGGLGWRSVFAIATGLQYEMTDRITLRGGYLFNTNPIPDTATLFNVQAPGITQHTLSLGASLKLTENIVASAGWVHGFRNDISGGVSQIPAATARIDTQSDSIVAGLNISFGEPRKKSAAIALAQPPAWAPATAPVTAPAPMATEVPLPEIPAESR